MQTAANSSITSKPRLRLRILAAAENFVRKGHPWIFADSVREQNRPGETGELAVVFDRQDKFLAVGLFDADSPIRVRVLHTGKPVTIDHRWLGALFNVTILRRKNLFNARTTGYRVINGESDGWPGLVMDCYDSTLVLKLYTAAWFPWLEKIVEVIRAQLYHERLVLRLSRNIQERKLQAPNSKFQIRDGVVLISNSKELFEGVVTFLENGLRFEADVLRGQKTGFFLDQRENRQLVEACAGNRTVLNAFSFSGGFSLYAARGGAKSVTDLDISAHALASAARNFALNQTDPTVSGCRRESIQADTFEWLEKNPGRKFGLIILDPPSFAKREAERAIAIRAYERLSALGIQRLSPDGILVSCSCSAHVSAAEFFEAVRAAARKSGRKFSELQTTRHAPDHAASFAEAEYLKAIYLKLA